MNQEKFEEVERKARLNGIADSITKLQNEVNQVATQFIRERNDKK